MPGSTPIGSSSTQVHEEKSAAYAGAEEEVFGDGVVVSVRVRRLDVGHGSGGGRGGGGGDGGYVICSFIKKNL